MARPILRHSVCGRVRALSSPQPPTLELQATKAHCRRTVLPAILEWHPHEILSDSRRRGSGNETVTARNHGGGDARTTNTGCPDDGDGEREEEGAQILSWNQGYLVQAPSSLNNPQHSSTTLRTLPSSRVDVIYLNKAALDAAAVTRTVQFMPMPRQHTHLLS